MEDEIPLPLLSAPEGARTISGDERASGSMDSDGEGATRATYTTLETRLSPAEILAHYARLLQAAGWTYSPPVTTGVSALQVLDMKDTRGRALRGILTATVRPAAGGAANERDVGLRVVRSRSR